MRLRVASLAFFLGSCSVAVAWLTILPAMSRLLDALRASAAEGSPQQLIVQRTRALLPFYLGADLLLVVALIFIILWFTLARPLRRLEESIQQLESLRLDLPEGRGGGPLLARVQSSLRRMAVALGEEQQTTRRQMDELRAANERIRRTQSELVASERLATVGRLAAGVAHEVGNPLSGILGYLALLRMKAKEAPGDLEYIDRIEAEVQRIDGIVRSLLDLGRPRALDLQPLDVAALVRSCVQLVRAGPELKNVDVEIAVPDSTFVRADSAPLSQVFINLFINAGQAMGARGRLRVHAETAGERVHLHVDDTGPGIPEDLVSRIFDPFFTTKDVGQGTGLGLAVSLHLVAAMDGKLTAHNLGGGGARFTVELPKA